MSFVKFLIWNAYKKILDDSIAMDSRLASRPIIINNNDHRRIPFNWQVGPGTTTHKYPRLTSVMAIVNPREGLLRKTFSTKNNIFMCIKINIYIYIYIYYMGYNAVM